MYMICTIKDEFIQSLNKYLSNYLWEYSQLCQLPSKNPCSLLLPAHIARLLKLDEASTLRFSQWNLTESNMSHFHDC